ncbi:MAG: ribulose-phosphate 3-epimerase [Alphaproteobacteria bacterium]
MIKPHRSISIAPSLLAADFTRLGEEVTAMTEAGADYLHLDVMDGHFVPNISFGAGLIKSLRPISTIPFDVHLMIAPVDPLLAEFAGAGAQIITFHPEAGHHPHRTLQAIKQLGCKAGLALNPATPIDVLDHVLDLVDLVLVMTVNPGFGGQSLIPLYDKIIHIRQKIDRANRPILLEVDGGVNLNNAPALIAAGVDILVAGTALFSQGAAHYKSAIQQLKTSHLQG